MEWIAKVSIAEKWAELTPWVTEHAFILVLGAAIIVQWVALQALVIHYQLFRARLKKPQPSQQRFARLERLIEFQDSRIEQVFEKYGELKKELNSVSREVSRPIDRSPAGSGASVESSFMSLGEINLKKRLETMKRS